MDHRHRKVIKNYSSTLQRSINLRVLGDDLRKSKIFTAHMLKDIYDDETSFFEELPTRGPNAFSGFIKLLNDNCYTSIAEKLCHVSEPSYHISDNNFYCCVISNYEFEGEKSSAESKELKAGYNSEFNAFDNAFQNCVDVKLYDNLEADKLFSKLKKFPNKKSLSSVKACIVIILGFGATNKDSKVIYCRDGKYILLHDILNRFSDSNCPSLKHKPKIFLLPSFDISCNDCVESVELSTDVNDTFLWYFPPLNIYKCIYNERNKLKNVKYFGQILSENFKADYSKYDFDTILTSSYEKFITQLKENKIPTEDLNDIPECERLGYCREKILFTSSVS